MTNLDWPEILERLASFANQPTRQDRLRKSAPLENAEVASEAFIALKRRPLVLKGGRRPFMEESRSLSFVASATRQGRGVENARAERLAPLCLETIA